MKISLEWENEEEGLFRCSEAENFCLTVKCFITGENEAELQIQDMVSENQNLKKQRMSKKVICKMTECLIGCFRRMWEEDFEETVLVEKKGSELSKILDSTDVVQKYYSEYMMFRRFDVQEAESFALDGGCVWADAAIESSCKSPESCGRKDATRKDSCKSPEDSGQKNAAPHRLTLTKENEGFFCENSEKSFFCRLLPYTAKAGERSFYLYEVAVEKKKRNQGIATDCLNRLFRYLAQQPPLTIYLQTGSYNEPAVHVYRKLGFEVSEEFCYYVPTE